MLGSICGPIIFFLVVFDNLSPYDKFVLKLTKYIRDSSTDLNTQTLQKCELFKMPSLNLSALAYRTPKQDTTMLLQQQHDFFSAHAKAEKLHACLQEESPSNSKTSVRSYET